jgi:predicted glycosyltransferase
LYRVNSPKDKLSFFSYRLNAALFTIGRFNFISAKAQNEMRFGYQLPSKGGTLEQLRVLMYSQDSSGLGSAYRTLAIALRLSHAVPDSSFLVLTDLPVFGRFELPPNLDYVHFPGVPDETGQADESANGHVVFDWKPLLRRKIILAAVESFDPHLVIVDRSPFGLRNELFDALVRLRERRPKVKVVLGLRDIPDNARTIQEAWDKVGTPETFRALYDEIWVYGTPKIFNHAQEYAIPTDIERKLVYTGYLKYGSKRNGFQKKLATEGIDLKRPLVLVIAGSGEDGYRLTDSYIGFLETRNGHYNFQSRIVCSPRMSLFDQLAFHSRVKRMSGVSIHQFHDDLDSYLYGATIVVSLSGYNTCCQFLSFRKRAVIMPRQDSTFSPFGQLRRAQTFHRYGVATMMHPAHLTAKSLGQEVLKQIQQISAPEGDYSAISLTGLDNITRRVVDLCRIPLSHRTESSLAGDLI